MNNKFLWGSVLIIALFSTSAYLYNKDKQKTLELARNETINDQIQRPEITLNAKHQFKDGQHVFVGLVELPNPCYKISTEAIKEQDDTALNIKYASTSEVCAEIVTAKEFSVSFPGTVDEIIIAKLNGELVNLNIFEIPIDKNIDDVKVYNKG